MTGWQLFAEPGSRSGKQCAPRRWQTYRGRRKIYRNHQLRAVLILSSVLQNMLAGQRMFDSQFFTTQGTILRAESNQRLDRPKYPRFSWVAVPLHPSTTERIRPPDHANLIPIIDHRNPLPAKQQKLLRTSKLAIDLDGMWLPGSWDVKGSSSYWPAWSKVLGYAPMPTQRGQAPGTDTLSGGWSWAISAKAKNQPLSWKLIEMMANKPNTALYDHLVVNLSPRKDSATLPVYKHTAANYAFSTYFRPAFPAYAKISVQIDTAMEAVMTGQDTPVQAMNAYAKAVTGIVGKAHVEALSHPENASQLRP